jgi:hypothetical protein
VAQSEIAMKAGSFAALEMTAALGIHWKHEQAEG